VIRSVCKTGNADKPEMVAKLEPIL
jgi:hypothetical protein